MIYLKRTIFWILQIIFVNIVLLLYAVPLPLYVKIPVGLILFGCSLYYLVDSGIGKDLSGKVKRFVNAYELLLGSIFCLAFELIFYLLFLLRIVIFPSHIVILIDAVFFPVYIVIINIVVGAVILFVQVLVGLIKFFTVSKNLGIARRVLVIVLWWLPIFNLILLFGICATARYESTLAVLRFRRNEARKKELVCATKYPLLLVHGIFFRDWSKLNYWGRIPAELSANGARIFYGEQQSAASVEGSATELRDRILEVLKQTGAEKVNIIAHSKGGLDSRYAISCLGMDRYVASLTTINTPHRGCKFSAEGLRIMPEKSISVIDKQYNKLFSKLGDEAPDFISGISQLTTGKCEQLNSVMPDSPGVYYQSAGSMMSKAGSAGVPLNLSYSIIKPLEGDNDGLVATTSMQWTNYSGTISVKGKKGVSHADMIDLLRYDIKDFDVLEYYVRLVQDLKERGF